MSDSKVPARVDVDCYLYSCYPYAQNDAVIRTLLKALKIHLAITAERVITETSNFEHECKKS